MIYPSSAWLAKNIAAMLHKTQFVSSKLTKLPSLFCMLTNWSWHKNWSRWITIRTFVDWVLKMQELALIFIRKSELISNLMVLSINGTAEPGAPKFVEKETQQVTVWCIFFLEGWKCCDCSQCVTQLYDCSLTFFSLN